MASVELDFVDLESANGKVAFVTLNRPEQANALNDDMIFLLNKICTQLASDSNCRVVVLKSRGKHFSAGADLSWMKAVKSTNPLNASTDDLAQVFAKIKNLPQPSIAVVRGAAYGGALGLTAACDIAIASEQTTFCFSEVKWGLLPAVILPYVSAKMSRTSLVRFGLTAATFSGREAFESGLVSIVASDQELHACLRQEIDRLLAGGPKAQRAFKQLMQGLDASSSFLSLCSETILRARREEEGQQGMSAFLDKRSPPWVSRFSKELDLS